jgi:hypothetical protein
MYHYDPNTALEELTEDATLPNPVHVRDMILRKHPGPDKSLGTAALGGPGGRSPPVWAAAWSVVLDYSPLNFVSQAAELRSADRRAAVPT